MIALTKTEVSQRMLDNYLTSLVNRIFKILPIKENEEQTMNSYVQSLIIELCGLDELVEELHGDPMIVTLLSILQYLSHPENCSLGVVRREVFHSISICNKLRDRYSSYKKDESNCEESVL